jgi:hypothetical protein
MYTMECAGEGVSGIPTQAMPLSSPLSTVSSVLQDHQTDRGTRLEGVQLLPLLQPEA